MPLAYIEFIGGGWAPANPPDRPLPAPLPPVIWPTPPSPPNVIWPTPPGFTPPVDPGYGRPIGGGNYPTWGPVLPPWSGNYPSTGPVRPGGPVDPGYGRPDLPPWSGNYPTTGPVLPTPMPPIYWPAPPDGGEGEPRPPVDLPPAIVVWIPGYGYVVATPGSPPTKPVPPDGTAEPKPVP
jgi:hypothetical protein